MQLCSAHLRLEEAQLQHARKAQCLQEQMSQLVPEAHVAELQHLLSLQKEETRKQLDMQQVSVDLTAPSWLLEDGPKGQLMAKL
jgi:hypothetical protein